MRISLILSLCFILILGCTKDEEPEAYPIISMADVSLEETDTNTTAQVALELSRQVDFDISLEVISRDGTASADDYVPVDTVIFFRAGETSVSLSLTILGDEFFEADEFFNIALQEPFNATIEDNFARVTIQNDDVHEFRMPSTGYVSSDSYEGMRLVWEENFDGNVLDESIWTYDIGDGCDQGICGWGNNELQHYAKDNISLVDGNLVIEARQESKGGKSYTSGRIITENKATFSSGRIDIRAVMPFGKGMWPALWMLGNNIDTVGWPACGEIDIMEMVGGEEDDSEVHGTVHWDQAGQYASFGGSTLKQDGKLRDEFHVYSILWDENTIVWYFDDAEYHVIDITPDELSEFRDEPFYFIMNIAVGGNWPGNPDGTTLFPQWMIVDYIRVFQKE